MLSPHSLHRGRAHESSAEVLQLSQQQCKCASRHCFVHKDKLRTWPELLAACKLDGAAGRVPPFPVCKDDPALGPLIGVLCSQLWLCIQSRRLAAQHFSTAATDGCSNKSLLTVCQVGALKFQLFRKYVRSMRLLCPGEDMEDTCCKHGIHKLATSCCHLTIVEDLQGARGLLLCAMTSSRLHKEHL